jgi:hypothetical protein
VCVACVDGKGVMRLKTSTHFATVMHGQGELCAVGQYEEMMLDCEGVISSASYVQMEG